ncbi:uncharacterized protein LOC131995912 [Stomoxys calcitrans]|uniref:uncharacterized protein LOC131995912 n=1 Tax=Stomoxys calcitrans TaxID=35570 RepID=UPI0027E37ECF|nr:uncharacterized protein LOC131995912 [Stomoxys calcitrans]
MITKTPDYLISEYGYPELWNADAKHVPLPNHKFWNTYSLWCSNKSNQLAKLLPLRESWNDYYTKNVLRQNEESNKYSKLTTNRKPQKNQQHIKVESNKKRSFHFSNMGSNTSIRRNGVASDGVNGNALMNSQPRSRTKQNMDNDVDQF